MITNPRIAVLALNPSNNGEESCGPKRNQIIIPAIDQLAEQKIQAFGPTLLTSSSAAAIS